MDQQRPISYYQEISMMMFGFGDSNKPNPDTVRLVETIVLKQLRMMVHEAQRYADQLDESHVQKPLKGEDLVFLLRNNKQKMRRFVKYLHNKDIKKQVELEKSEIINLIPPKNSLLKFIETLDETGELMDMDAYDSVKHDRMIRADRLSQALEEEKYLEFHKARCKSFNSTNMDKMRAFDKIKAWIDPDKQITFADTAYDVLTYLAYETVAQIIDLAFIVRQDSKRTNYDPLGMLSGSYYSAAAFNALHYPDGLQDNLRVQTGQPPLTVAEVRESARRVFMPQVGNLKFGGKLPDSKRLLAL